MISLPSTPPNQCDALTAASWHSPKPATCIAGYLGVGAVDGNDSPWYDLFLARFFTHLATTRPRSISEMLFVGYALLTSSLLQREIPCPHESQCAVVCAIWSDTFRRDLYPADWRQPMVNRNANLCTDWVTWHALQRLGSASFFVYEQGNTRPTNPCIEEDWSYQWWCNAPFR